jgi:hypothetical protein
VGADEAVGPNAPEGTAITLATWAAIWKLEGFLQKLVREGKSEDRRLGSIKQELASLWAQQVGCCHPNVASSFAVACS